MSPRTSTNWARRIRWLIGCLLGLEVLYLLAANLFLQPWAGPQWISKRPDKFLIAWQAAWTVVPGLLHARGLHLRGKTPKQRWELEVDTLRTWVVVPKLLQRHLAVVDARASGVEFRLAPEPAPGNPAHHPTIEGFAPPLDHPKTSSHGFSFAFEDAQFDGIREIWLYHQRYLGQGHLAASAHIKKEAGEVANPEVSIPQLELTLESGILSINGEETGKLEQLAADLVIAPYHPKEHRSLAGLRFVSGTLQLEAPQAQLDILGQLFRDVPWIDLKGEGALQVDLRLEGGRIVPQSWLHAWAQVDARYLDFLIAGQARVRGAVVDVEGDTLPSTLEVTFDNFSVRQENQSAPHAFGAGAVLRATGRQVDLAQPHFEWTVNLNLPSAEVPDLTYYNAYLPPKSSVALVSGAGRVAAELRFDLPSAQVDGEVHVVGEKVNLRFQDVAIRGNLSIDTKIQNGDANTRRFNVAGTRLRIDHAGLGTVAAPGATTGWWGEVTIRRGQVELDPLALEGVLDFRLRDTEPFVRLLNRGKERPKWLNKFLDIQHVTGHGSVAYREAAVDLGGVDLQFGERLRVLGEFKLSNERPHLLLFGKLGVLTVAVEQVGQERAWGPLRSLRWYEARRDAWRGRGRKAP